LLREIPSVAIPDDHDVFHGNLWGAGGVLADISQGFSNWAQDSGGYKMSPEFVNAVHRTQTGNLPDPADPEPVGAGISAYYTRWSYGLLDIAILSDRQFKSAPRDLLPEARIENGWPQNLEWDVVGSSDHPEAELLGTAQERFLADWSAQPAAGTAFRIVLSQSPWCAPQTLPEGMHSDRGVPSLPILKPGEYPPDDRPTPDFDTNGWPLTKRTAALRWMRQANAVHISGDQHLGTTGQYGLDAHGDGPWWIVTPAIANIWPRRWMPAEPGRNRRPDDPPWLGEFQDGLGNKITLHAVANPLATGREPARLYDRAVGYTITRYDPATGRISLENWPYWAGPDRPEPENRPYPGWPIVIDPNSGQRIR
jgi:alkaline phosphatase D